MSGLSSSQAGSQSPVRAIPSSFASKIAPAVPLASQTYEPLVKAELRRRLLSRIFPASAAFTWAYVALLSMWNQSHSTRKGALNILCVPFTPSTIAFSLGLWTLGVVPVIVVRKAFMSSHPSSAASPSAVFHAAMKRNSTTRALLVYASSAVAILLLRVLMAYVDEATAAYDPRLTLFVKSKKHPYYLNGRLLYLLTAQTFLAGFFLFRNAMVDRFAVPWKSIARKPEQQQFVLAQIITSVITALCMVGLTLCCHLLLFILARWTAPFLFYLPIVNRLLRPFLAHYQRFPSLMFPIKIVTRDPSLAFRAFHLCLYTAIVWEFAESVFDSFVSQPVQMAHTTADPSLTTVSGTTSSDLYFKYFAYAELRQLANDESDTGSTRRTALFTDQKYNPSMWATLVRESLQTLGEDYQLLLRRGTAPAAVPKPVVPEKKLGLPPQVTATPLIRKDVLKPARSSPLRSALDTLASDGPISNAVSSAAEIGAVQLPELFRSVISPPTTPTKPPPAPSAPTPATVEESKKVASSISERWRLSSKELRERTPGWVLNACARVEKWWTRERVNRAVEAALPNRKLDALAVESLCSLVCASLKEDRYGVVQRDIPRIIEAMLSFLTAVEDYQREIHTRYPQPSPEEMQSLSLEEQAAKLQVVLDVALAGDVFSEVMNPLKEGIVKVVRTFGDKLAAFKFPPRTAKKLQGFVDYN